MIKRPVWTELSLMFGAFGAVFGVLLIAVFGLFVLPFIVPLGGPEIIHPAKLVDPNGMFIEVASEHLYVTYTPSANSSNGDDVLLIHGFGGSTVTWIDTVPALAKAGYDVVAVDLLGFGLSEKEWDHDYSHAAQSARVLGIMDALGIERAVVVGHSMGGNVAAHLALSHPERVERLVLVSASVLSDRDNGSSMIPVPVELLDFPVARRWAQILIREYVPSQFEGMLFDAAYQDTMITATVASGYRRSLYTPGWDLGLLGIMRDGRANELPLPISDLDVPTLLVWGARDTWVPAQQGETLQALIPGAKRVEFASVGHLPMHEVPADFNATLLAFLSGD